MASQSEDEENQQIETRDLFGLVYVDFLNMHYMLY